MKPMFASFTAQVGPRTYVVNGAYQYDFDALYSSVEMVLQNIYETITTPLGSQVLFRDYGTDWSIIDMPGNLASYAAQVAVLEACAKWEPRAKFLRIVLTPVSAENYLAGVFDLYCELEIDLTADIAPVLYGAPGPISIWTVAGDFSSTAPPQVAQITALV
jgi:phage baseplate assembly protein W